jgi:hypothetical protein
MQGVLTGNPTKMTDMFCIRSPAYYNFRNLGTDSVFFCSPSSHIPVTCNVHIIKTGTNAHTILVHTQILRLNYIHKLTVIAGTWDNMLGRALGGPGD